MINDAKTDKQGTLASLARDIEEGANEALAKAHEVSDAVNGPAPQCDSGAVPHASGLVESLKRTSEIIGYLNTVLEALQGQTCGTN